MSPGYVLCIETYADTDGIPSSWADIGPALGRGWFVSVPDHEGPLASLGLRRTGRPRDHRCRQGSTFCECGAGQGRPDSFVGILWRDYGK